MRRFPPPLTSDEANDAYFIVRDWTGQALGYWEPTWPPMQNLRARLATNIIGRGY
jgi:hypothetical protein